MTALCVCVIQGYKNKTGCWHLWPLEMCFVASAWAEHKQDMTKPATSMN